MLVVLVCTLGVRYGVVGTETGKGVDMPIGVVTAEMAVLKPQDALYMQQVFQFFFDVCTAHTGISLFVEQAV